MKKYTIEIELYERSDEFWDEVLSCPTEENEKQMIRDAISSILCDCNICGQEGDCKVTVKSVEGKSNDEEADEAKKAYEEGKLVLPENIKKILGNLEGF